MLDLCIRRHREPVHDYDMEAYGMRVKNIYSCLETVSVNVRDSAFTICIRPSSTKSSCHRWRLL